MAAGATLATATRAASRPFFRRPSVMPGFPLAFGYAVTYLGLIVLLPLAALVWRASAVGLDGLWAIATEERVAAALKVSFGISFAAAAIDAAFGLLVAWVLTRYRFPGRKLLDAAIDLPFALPTAVAGIALAALYAPNGWVGSLVVPFKIAFTPYGILIALVFVGLPFCVRTVQPLVAEIDKELEEAAATLGASRTRAVWTVLLPPLVPAILTGFALAFARAVGEYGSVIFVAGNIPYVSEIAPLLIIIKLEEFNYTGATAIATIMLAISFLTLLVINGLQAYSRRRYGHA
ncbi:MAG TPA: sulfate ABC transporter permease subunit CysT [Microvirga sp.]|jgi:sulfate/thiosulfate transport system permease protein|nr:sulfate ABC transporter permease subunit CysT [Microvirga sp.]